MDGMRKRMPVFACARVVFFFFSFLFCSFKPTTLMSGMHVCCCNMSAVGSRAPILNQPLNYLLCFKFRAMIKFHHFVRQDCYPIPARMNIFIRFEMTETRVLHETIAKTMGDSENKIKRETQSRAQLKKECFK